MALSRSASSRMIVGPFTELQEGGFGAGTLRHGVAHSRAAGQAHRVRAWVCDHLVSHLGLAEEEIDRTFRHARFEKALHHPYRDDGRGGGRLQTTVLPAAKAADRYSLGMPTGKFQGVIIATTPCGWRMVRMRLLGSTDGTILVSNRLMFSAASR